MQLAEDYSIENMAYLGNESMHVETKGMKEA